MGLLAFEQKDELRTNSISQRVRLNIPNDGVAVSDSFLAYVGVAHLGDDGTLADALPSTETSLLTVLRLDASACGSARFIVGSTSFGGRLAGRFLAGIHTIRQRSIPNVIRRSGAAPLFKLCERRV